MLRRDEARGLMGRIHDAVGRLAHRDPLDPLDQDARIVLAELEELGARPLHELEPGEARRQPTLADAVEHLLLRRRITACFPVDVPTRDLVFHGRSTPLCARLYAPRPGGACAGALVLYLHGGGFVVGDLDAFDATPRGLAARTGATVLSVDYRRAPEHRFPAAHDDAWAAWRFAVESAEALGGDGRRFAVAGEDAGATLALHVAARARDGKGARPAHQLLAYPIAGTPATRAGLDGLERARPLGGADLAWMFERAFVHPEDADDPRIDLVERADLAGLPPATVVLAEIDPLRAEGELLARRLVEAGVPTAARTFAGAPHGFLGLGTVVAQARAAMAFACDGLRGTLACGG